MPPFVGTNVFFTDGTETLSISSEEGTVEIKGGWVVVTEGDRVRSFPQRNVHYVDARS
jgi:hypothetical protein